MGIPKNVAQRGPLARNGKQLGMEGGGELQKVGAEYWRGGGTLGHGDGVLANTSEQSWGAVFSVMSKIIT